MDTTSMESYILWTNNKVIAKGEYADNDLLLAALLYIPLKMNRVILLILKNRQNIFCGYRIYQWRTRSQPQYNSSGSDSVWRKQWFGKLFIVIKLLFEGYDIGAIMIINWKYLCGTGTFRSSV